MNITLIGERNATVKTEMELSTASSDQVSWRRNYDNDRHACLILPTGPPRHAFLILSSNDSFLIQHSVEHFPLQSTAT